MQFSISNVSIFQIQREIEKNPVTFTLFEKAVFKLAVFELAVFELAVFEYDGGLLLLIMVF